MIIHIIEAVYHFLWGDLVTLHLSGTSIGIPLLVLLLIPTGIYFTFRTNFVSVRLFPDMVRSLTEKKGNGNSLSPLQTLFVSTATRVGMGNLVGVVAAVSAGGAGGVVWGGGFPLRRCCVLDVAFRYFRLCHCFYRGNSGPDP